MKSRSGNQIATTLSNLRLHIHSSGLSQINMALEEVKDLLQSPKLNLVEQFVLQGRARELRTAKWLLSRVLLVTDQTTQASKFKDLSSDLIANTSSAQEQNIWASLHQTVMEGLEGSLQNLTTTPLEIDILKEDKRRELLQIVLQQFALLLHELAESQIGSTQLLENMSRIHADLWQSAMSKFLGKYYTLNYEGKSIEVVNVLLEDRQIVQVAILDKIPLVYNLYGYLLFHNHLVINNTVYEANTSEAIARARIILENLLIHTANAIIQPLLNHFAEIEEIKQKFYDYRRISTREMERFRNDLSWRYRVEIYWEEPRAIYESQFHLFTLSDGGIKKINVYTYRNQELMKLRGIPLFVTLLLEFQDAIAPRLRAIAKFIGSGLVYFLKNILGRGIGLIGRGVLQGIGDSFSNGKLKQRRGNHLR